MAILLFVSMFLTVFLLLSGISMLRKSKDDQYWEKSPRSFSEVLKDANQQLKNLLIRKKKPGKKRNTLQEQLSIAGVLMKPEEFAIFRWMFAVITAGLLHLITGNFVLMLLGFASGFVLPMLWLKRKQKKRIKAFNDGLPGMITSIIGSLRAGFGFLQSLQIVAQESYSPIKDEVELVLKSLQYGTSMDDALLEWKRRMPSAELGLLVDAIIIQRQSGGNLAYLLDKIVKTNRARTKIESQIKTLTAQGKLSGLIISLLPVVLGLLIFIINPEYIMTLFTNPIGMLMLVAAGIGFIIGFIFVHKITTIEV
ncbi:type II secretion system F family protein [Virgibacillus siamensis]|uniref:type II secretion system F family protein n=1 Tax=Virgibacillus siamensis TaxID=480071 RepID=UPI001FE99787|nr:type II secretion system F family protein [Virgibacillus siamensis]